MKDPFVHRLYRSENIVRSLFHRGYGRRSVPAREGRIRGRGNDDARPSRHCQCDDGTGRDCRSLSQWVACGSEKGETEAAAICQRIGLCSGPTVRIAPD